MDSIDSANWTDSKGHAHGGAVIHACEEDIKVIDCETCGFNHIIPLPEEEELAEFYRETFYEVERPDYFKGAVEDQAWLDLSFGDRFDSFSDLLGIPTGKVLDIGCGPGSFLAAGKERGWTVCGVEPSRQATEYANDQGLDVINAPFEASLVADRGPFDVIHMSEVLEHIQNPRSVLADAVSALRSGGLLTISVPNDFNGFQNCLATLDGFSHWWVVPTHHLNYFSFDTLEALVNDVGLTPVLRDTNFPMELFLLMGKNYTTDPELGSALHADRKTFDLTLAKNGGQETRRTLYQALANAGLGRLAIVTARKP